jgi:Spy/CpxP family protein refolding chaperone
MIAKLLRMAALGIAGAVCLSAQAAGQGPVSKPWWNSEIAQELNLTPQQQQRIHQIIRSYRDRLFDARNEAHKAEADLADLLNEPSINWAEAQRVTDRLAEARATSTRVFTEMSIQLRSVLTIQQWRELSKRWPEIQRRRNNGQ